MDLDAFAHPTQGTPPVELLHFVVKAMAKDREERWATAATMVAELEAALDGRIRVQCPMTLTKRITREASRFVDRHPRGAFYSLVTTALVVLFGLGSALLALAT